MRTRLHLRTVFLIVSFLFCAGLHAQTETQTFDSASSAESAGWFFNEEGQSSQRFDPSEDQDNRCREDEPCETNLGWKESRFAGGENAGEGGGLVHRSGGLPVGFYADTTIGELNLDMPFSASGRVSLVNTSVNGHYHFGFFDGHRVLLEADDPGAHLGFLFAEPKPDIQPNLRWGPSVVNDGDTRFANHDAYVAGAASDAPLDFFIGYEPTGDGVLTLLIGDDDIAVIDLSPEIRAEPTTLTAFGVWTAATPSNARPNYMEIFLDDLSYTSLEGDGEVAAGLDFNADTLIDVADLDLLVGEIVANSSDTKFDLNGDGTISDVDLSRWLSDAAQENGIDQPYLAGDANLDGTVNATDLNAMALRWQQEVTTWSGGDFTANGKVDAADLNVLALNWQKEIPAAAAAVPEPASACLLLWVFASAFATRSFRSLIR